MHTHFNRDRRIALGALKRAGLSQAEMARQLGVHRSTIGREVQRNQREQGGYHATHADVVARQRRRVAKLRYRTIENDTMLQHKIVARLSPLISPEVVAYENNLHHQTIYSWVYRSRPDLLPQLPQRGRKRRRYGSKRSKKQGWTRLVTSIHDRPPATISWEGDTIKGSTLSRLLTHVECRSLYTRADVMPDGTADSVYAQLKANPLPDQITYDRGSEFALWAMIERDAGATVFFADPHSPWQRGKNENTNGRLRRVFPKKFDFATITQKQLDEVVYVMNHTPRKSLGFKTPCSLYERGCCNSD